MMFRKASKHYKWVSEATELAYVNNPKVSIASF